MSLLASTNSTSATSRTRLIDTNMQRKPDYWILAAVIGLCLMGIIMVYSATYVEMLGDVNPDSAGLARTQLQNMLLGFVLLVGCAAIPYNFWRRFSVPAMAFILISLILVLVAPESISPEVNGAHRWLRFPFQWQPSELCKVILILYIADWLSQKGQRVRNLTYGLIPFGIVMGVISALVMKEPDMGTTMVLCTIGVIMFFVAGAHMVQFLGSIALAGGVFFVLMTTASYRLDRLDAWLKPWADPLGVGWHSTQSLMAIGSGGWLGQGLGSGRQKFGWLPEQYTDTIFAVLGQEWGFMGAVILLGLFTLLMVRGIRAALKAPDAYGMLLATGVSTWLGFQALINIGAVSGAIPFTGLTLPFISSGGSSLLVTLAGVGLLLNVSRYSRSSPPPELIPVHDSAAPDRWRSVSSTPRLSMGTTGRRLPAAVSSMRNTPLFDSMRSTVNRTWSRNRRPPRGGSGNRYGM